MITVAICDDEPHMVRELLRLLSDYTKEKHISCYRVSSFYDSRSLLESRCDFDIIFLDIQMEHPNGMESARILRERNYRSLLIFVTVLKECVFDAFAVEAYDYLLKPVDAGRFGRTMDRTLRALEQRAGNRVVVRRGAFCDIIPFDDILYCEVRGRKIYIHRGNGDVTEHYERLDDFQRRVDGRFFRCHRSYLINLDDVRSCGNGEAVLSRGDRVPVSRLREKEFMQVLMRRMKERGL